MVAAASSRSSWLSRGGMGWDGMGISLARTWRTSTPALPRTRSTISLPARDAAFLSRFATPALYNLPLARSLAPLLFAAALCSAD